MLVPTEELQRRSAVHILLKAYKAFLPLADPRWWARHQPVKLNARTRRLLRDLRRRRKRVSRAPQTPELALRILDAFAIFIRMGDDEGIRSGNAVGSAADLPPTEYEASQKVGDQSRGIVWGTRSISRPSLSNSSTIRSMVMASYGVPGRRPQYMFPSA